MNENNIMMNLGDRKNIIILLILIVINLNVINACYITNCPWGGKRSQPFLDFENAHQCRKCASGLGMCFGPKICCGPDMGCLVDTKESSVCQLEDLKSNVPCQPYGKICDKVEYGRCATSNLCCNPEHCLEDSTCASDDIDYSEEYKEIDAKVLKAIKRLISKRRERNEKYDDGHISDKYQSNF